MASLKHGAPVSRENAADRLRLGSSDTQDRVSDQDSRFEQTPGIELAAGRQAWHHASYGDYAPMWQQLVQLKAGEDEVNARLAEQLQGHRAEGRGAQRLFHAIEAEGAYEP